MSERFGPVRLVAAMAMRPPRRLFAAVVMMALISFLLVFALLLGETVEQRAVRGAGRLGADIMIVPKGTGVAGGAKLIGGFTTGSPLPEGIEGRIASTAGVRQVVPQYLFSSAADPCCELGNVLLIGFDPLRDFTVLPWLRPGDRFSGNQQQILAGSRVMKATGAAMRFYDSTFTLAARLESSGVAEFDSALFIPLNGLAAMEQSSQKLHKPPVVSRGKPSLLMIRLEPASEPLQTARTLEQQNPGIQAVTIAASLRDNRHRLEALGDAGKPLAAAAWLASLSLGGMFLLLNFRSRRKSLGLLRAFGFGRLLLATMFALEAAALCLAGMVAGGGGAFLALRIIGPALALTTGLPLTSGWLTEAASSLLRSLPAFPVIMGIEAVGIVLLTVKNDAAELLRGA